MDIARQYDYSQGQTLYPMASNIYKNIVPLNARMLIKGTMNKFYGGGQSVNENYLTPDELNFLRKAWKHSMIGAIEKDKNNKDYYPAVVYNDYEAFEPNSKNKLNEFDAKNLKLSDLILKSYTSPSFVASTSTGKIKWYPKDNGEIILNDSYDFIKGLGEVLPKSDYAKLHTFGEKFTKPYPVSINLGNPSNWWNKL